MKNNEIQDERIVLERRKMQSTAYSWIVIILLISIIVQQFLMNASFVQYAVEFSILIGCGLYNIVSNFKKGIDIWNPSAQGKKKILLNTIMGGVISVILLVFLSGESDPTYLVSYFVSFVIFFFLFRSVMCFITQKKQEAIMNKLNEDGIEE